MLRRIRNYPFLMWFGGALLLTVVFLGITEEFRHPEPRPLDLAILHEIVDMRSQMVTDLFVNLTALGSTTLITLHTLIAFVMLISARDRIGAWQLAFAWVGAMILTEYAKDWIDRPRPTAIPALVDTFGFSYPSGHAVNAAAMYVTIAALGLRHLPLLRQRILLAVIAFIVILGIGFSRVYLGAHYASDALSGVVLGTAWALLLAGIVSMLESSPRVLPFSSRKSA